jgi:hypothetical protein
MVCSSVNEVFGAQSTFGELELGILGCKLESKAQLSHWYGARWRRPGKLVGFRRHVGFENNERF